MRDEYGEGKVTVYGNWTPARNRRFLAGAFDNNRNEPLSKIVDNEGFFHYNSNMRLLAFRILILLMVGMFFNDVLIDSTQGCEQTQTQVTSCHACQCGPHFVSPPASTQFLTSNSHSYVSYKPSLHSLSVSKSIFHPPAPLA